jgi:hypothetical protein
MLQHKDRWPTIIMASLAIITIVIGVFSYIGPPAIFPDPSWGFQVMRSMERGGAFNLMIGPDQDNIAKDTSFFLTWWSPGQYMVPYFFKTLLGVNTAHASVITIVLFELLGLFGFYAFFKKIGFTPMIAALSVAFIATQQFYFTPYAFYNGGEVLMFGYVGWFLYGCFSFRKIDGWLLLFVLLAGWIGFFCKSSMLLIFLSGICCLWINLSQPDKNWWTWIKNGIWLGVPALLSIAGIYLFFLRKGSNPASQNNGWRIIWETFTFPLASPLIAGFSVDDMTQGLVYHPDGGLLTHTGVVVVLILLSLLTIALIYAIIKWIPSPNYRLLIVVFYIASVVFFSYAFFRQLAISYEGRHFRTIGLLIVPGVIYLVCRTKLAYRLLFGLLWLFIGYFSIQMLSREYQYNIAEGIRGNSGLNQGFVDQPSLNKLMKLDREHNNALFVFISADLGLEIEHNRIITIEPIGRDVKVKLEDYVYDGHAGPLYILLPSDYAENGRARFIQRCFPGYKNFKVDSETEDYIIYSAE